jgi:Restriction endonuclease XhoI
MDGFCQLVQWVLVRNGLPEPSIYTRTDLELPGYFRPTKKWDMLIVQGANLIAAVEFKSQRGPSFGNNLNNRSEEALGSAVDLWTAYREGALVNRNQEPGLDGSCSSRNVPALWHQSKLRNLTSRYFPNFATPRTRKGTNYSCASCSWSEYTTEPAKDLTMKRVLAGLAGHVASYEAAIK